jgi:Activator of Hsp90 ATPase homolog 1-like protein
MTSTLPVAEMQTFSISEEISVRASIERTFESLLANMGRLNEGPDGNPIPMVLEARPGGRWYRDFGGDNGHMWGLVQSIKRPALLEIWGPLFMSTAATSNVQYRLSETPEGTLITFTHTLVGPFPEDHRPKLAAGWSGLHARVRKMAEASAKEGQ